MLFSRLVLTMLFFSFLCPPSQAQAQPKIPDLLQPWTEWVLDGHEERLLCTPSHASPDDLRCDWPSSLELKVTEKEAYFTQLWLVQNERWIQLPGSEKNWPEDIRIDGETTLVFNRDGVPHIRVPAGRYGITGRFTWTALPEFLTVPGHTGIVDLELRGRKIPFPDLDAAGRLWLRARETREEKIENRLTVHSFRMLDDTIPLKESVLLRLDVAGAAREIVLGPVFTPDAAIPVSLDSKLPARLEQGGTIRVQARPGQWDITLVTRSPGPVAALTFSRPDDGFWPREEIWSFNGHPELRLVEIEGVPAIDPLQTSMPEQWRNYPAYRIGDGETLRFREIKRGDPHPAPDQLGLQRNIWLRFDGAGYTIQDVITGSKTSDWRLEMKPPVRLGRVSVDGREQFITKRKGTDKTGVELRKGVLNLTADSEYDGISTLPATGWDHDFRQVGAKLFLPPGWRLINASGIDHISGTWVNNWTLLDFFLVLIFTLAVARLYSKTLAAAALAALVIIYHEPLAPRWIWLAILVGIALLRHLPDGRLKTAVKVYQVIAILLLAGIVIPFSVQQLRTGIYPQLEKPRQAMLSLPALQPAELEPPMPRQQAVTEEMPMDRAAGKTLGTMAKEKVHVETDMERKAMRGDDEIAQYDPGMVNQTGPGIPDWRWNTVTLSWSGPVQRDQEVSLFFTGPATNLILSFLRVILVSVLIAGLFGIRYHRGEGFSAPPLKFIVLLSLLAAVAICPPPAAAGEIPPPQMLEELRQRLLEPDDCFPACADISSMHIALTPDHLQISLTVAGRTGVSFPLPGNVSHWIPREVRIDGEPAAGLFRTDDELWIMLPEGEHQIMLAGSLPGHNTVQLPLPLKPHRVTADAAGWTVEGIHENGSVDNQIQFTRIGAEQEPPDQILGSGVLPPFLLIERTIHLGLTWNIETTVRRLSPVGSAAVFDYPLLPGESVVTEGIRVQDSTARIILDSRQTFLQWESVLEKTDLIRLRHADTTLWSERWRVNASPIFHLETEGIPVILHQQGDRWYPTWHPWPGEEVRLTVSRPAGVEGQTMTMEKSHLAVHPGRRATDAILQLSLRSSQGGRHTIVLPEAAQLQEVLVNGLVQPIRQEGRRVPLPVTPGLQEIQLKWRHDTGMTAWYATPEVDLGIASVNANIDLHLPGARWPLFMGGPLMGPAVLFWSVVLIILLVAFGLSRTGLTPLRFHQWFLLGIGMSQSNIGAGLLVAGWLIGLDLRRRARPDLDKTAFNCMQIGIVFLTVLAIGSLLAAISMGLLGHPDMNIIGNGSHSGLLRWYQDRSGQMLPKAWIVSIPLYAYRAAMLAWALWISFTLITLLKWGWKRFSEPVLWHRIPRKPKVREKEPPGGGRQKHE